MSYNFYIISSSSLRSSIISESSSLSSTEGPSSSLASDTGFAAVGLGVATGTPVAIGTAVVVSGLDQVAAESAAKNVEAEVRLFGADAKIVDVDGPPVL